MTQLDDNKADIVDAIESLNRLAISVRKQEGTIDATLEQLPSALTSLDQQRGDLVRMLRALNRLGDVGVRVIKASKDSTIESLRLLDPVLTELAATGDNFAKSFNVFLTYPFVDEVVGRDPQVARNLHMGDYTNLSIELDVSVTGDEPVEPPTDLPTNLPTILDPTVILDNVAKCLQSGDPTSAACRKVLRNVESLAELREECQKKENRGQGHLQAAQPPAGRSAAGWRAAAACRPALPRACRAWAARRLRADRVVVAPRGRRCAS